MLRHVQLFATPWTGTHQVPLSMKFSSLELWSGLPFPPPGNLPDPVMEPASPVSPALAGGSFTTEPPGKPRLDSVQSSPAAQSCPTLCDPMNRSTPGLPVHHQLPESTQTHVQQVGDAIQPSHPLLSPSPPALNPSQHQGLSQWVSSCIRWPKYWSFSLNISPSNEHPGLISFRMDWLDLLAVQGTIKSLLQHHSSKHQFFSTQLSL